VEIFGGPLNLGELCECETQKEGMADKRTGKEGAMHLTPYDNCLP
jgi:hypothetical protein